MEVSEDYEKDAVNRKRKSASLDALIGDIYIAGSEHGSDDGVTVGEKFSRRFRRIKRRTLEARDTEAYSGSSADEARSQSDSGSSFTQFESGLRTLVKNTNGHVVRAMNVLKMKLLLALCTQDDDATDDSKTFFVRARDANKKSDSPPTGKTAASTLHSNVVDAEHASSSSSCCSTSASSHSSSSGDGQQGGTPSSDAKDTRKKLISKRRKRRSSRSEILLNYITEECGEELVHSGNSELHMLLLASRLSSVAVREARKIVNRRSRCLISLPRRYFNVCQALGEEFGVQLEPVRNSTDDTPQEDDEEYVNTDLLSVYVVIQRALAVLREESEKPFD